MATSSTLLRHCLTNLYFKAAILIYSFFAGASYLLETRGKYAVLRPYITTEDCLPLPLPLAQIKTDRAASSPKEQDSPVLPMSAFRSASLDASVSELTTLG